MNATTPADLGPNPPQATTRQQRDTASTPDCAEARQWIPRLILIVAITVQLSRILNVQSSTGEMPFYSANDRSRWCTIAALAVNGNYEIDDLIEIRDPKTRRRVWHTIDMVQHRGADGLQHFYSSKPPLLPTLYTGVYMVIRDVTGATLMKQPFLVARLMLIVVNLIPLALFWFLLIRWMEQEHLDLWAMVVMTTFIAWGTYLSTFVTTLNNHLPAALAVGASLWLLHRVAIGGDRRWRWFALAGLCNSFGAANELPALSWVAAVGVYLAIVDLRRTLTGYLPALAPVTIAFFAANYAAHGVWKPAYAHRDVGPTIGQCELQAPLPLAALQEIAANQEPSAPGEITGEKIAELREALTDLSITSSEQSLVRSARREGVYELWDPSSQQRIALKPREDQPKIVDIYQWGDWYDYPSSYWVGDRKQGVDRGEPNRGLYVLHCLIGHHGIFSLTPFWLLVPLGCYVVWKGRTTWNPLTEYRMLLAAAVAATSLVAIGFYFARPLEDRNYGGVSSGFRWGFWLIPLWLWLSAQAITSLRSRWSRAIVIGLLAASIFTASFPWTNPWTSPWIMQWMQHMGWL